MKSQVIKPIKIHPEGNEDVRPKFHVNPSDVIEIFLLKTTMSTSR